MLSIVVAAICARIVATLPDRWRRWLADRFATLWHRAATTYRANVRSNLAQVVGNAGDGATLDQMVRDIFRTSARNFADLLRSPHLSDKSLVSLAPLPAELVAVVRGAQARGQGLVIMTAHLGPFDLIAQSFGAHGLPMTVVTGRTTSRFIFDAVTYLRRRRHLSAVEPTPAGVREVIRVVRRGGIAGFVADYDFFQNGVELSFFGRVTTFPPGPIRIARDAGALVLCVFAERVNGDYQLRMTAPFVVEKTDDRDLDVRRGLACAIALIEAAIAQAPNQWVMFQQVWPSEPVDPVRVFPVGSPFESDLLKRVDAVLPPRRRDEPAAD